MHIILCIFFFFAKLHISSDHYVVVAGVLQHYQADLMVVVAYGLILPEIVLNTPRLGCVNVHASLLPRWRCP